MEQITMQPTQRLSGITWTALALVVIGALNWGLVGLFELDLVAALFGQLSALSRIIYVVIAAAGLYLIAIAPRLRSSGDSRLYNAS